jgi:uncharacterized protein (TIGR03435 family)
MTRKTIIILVIAGAAFLTVAAAAIVKLEVSPTLKDSYFEPDSDKLRQVPANIVVVRKTHFPNTYGKIRHVHDGDSLARTVGHDVILRDLIAEAYDCEPGQVVLPPDATHDQFDFLVTMPGHTREHLRQAISKTLGYTAHTETRDTDVFKLKVTDASLPGLVVSPNSEDSDVQFKDGKLFFTHKTMDYILHGLQDGLARPVIDETGLTNSYNFSLAWNQKVMQAMQDGAFNLDRVQTVLHGWGLTLEPATQTMDMVIVEKAQ